MKYCQRSLQNFQLAVLVTQADASTLLYLSKHNVEYVENMEKIQEINSWRIYSQVLGTRISVELPQNSDLQEVEVIIIPRKRKVVSEKKAGSEEWKNDFLKISQWNISEDDIRMKSWQIPEC